MNKKLERIFKEDQKDRKTIDLFADYKKVQKRDRDRKALVAKMIEKDHLKIGRDYYLAAFIYHHGMAKTDRAKALRLAERSMDLGYKKAKWLVAAATDRKLVSEGRKQKYGTQFFQKDSRSKMKLSPVDPKTTDEERAEYNVPPLSKIKSNLVKMKQSR